MALFQNIPWSTVDKFAPYFVELDEDWVCDNDKEEPIDWPDNNPLLGLHKWGKKRSGFGPIELVKDLLYLSNVIPAANPYILRDASITNIVHMAECKPFWLRREDIEEEGITDWQPRYLRLYFPDESDVDISNYFEPFINYINRVKSDGGRVLVHCTAGHSRSVAMCLVYLSSVGCDPWDELKKIKRLRGSDHEPYEGWMEAVSRYDNSQRIKQKLIMERTESLTLIKQHSHEEKVDKVYEAQVISQPKTSTLKSVVIQVIQIIKNLIRIARYNLLETWKMSERILLYLLNLLNHLQG
ncbi:hypothetical protein G9A89_019638 [Geosiphon pyriformis]|nr:hypothetical protein G9A89_019638 [Geosiphon pyriformis]